MRPARPDQLEAGARQSRVLATPCKFGYRLAARNSSQPSTLGIFLREFSFGVLMLVVMTTTARAALLQGDQHYSPDGSAAGQRQKFRISPGPPSE
jgi:hypothetical protein